MKVIQQDKHKIIFVRHISPLQNLLGKKIYHCYTSILEIQGDLEKKQITLHCISNPLFDLYTDTQYI